MPLCTSRHAYRTSGSIGRVVQRGTTLDGVSEVPVRELNQNTAGVLARVKRGKEIDITERGAIIARLVPAQPHPLADLIVRQL